MSENSKVVIKPMDNGPLRVKGPMTILDGDGEPYEVTRKVVLLCRCGGSSNKPFCDGTHARVGFESVARAGSSEAHDSVR